MYIEGNDSTVTHNNEIFVVDNLISLCKNKKTKFVPIKELTWILPHTKVFSERLINLDTTIPLIVLLEDNKLILLDGAHRLTLLNDKDNKIVEVYILLPEEIIK